jgi:hypothetical protein
MKSPGYPYLATSSVRKDITPFRPYLDTGSTGSAITYGAIAVSPIINSRCGRSGRMSWFGIIGSGIRSIAIVFVFPSSYSLDSQW